MTEPDDELTRESFLDPAERDIEAPTADAWDQARPADPMNEPLGEIVVGLEVPEADAVEQATIVSGDDEDY